MLVGKDREIAVQAIAASASGTPSEVAAQILAGVSALDHAGKPLVVWPVNLTTQEQIEALEREMARLRQIMTGIESLRVRRENRDLEDSAEGRGYPEAGTHSAESGEHLQASEALSVRSGEAKGSGLPAKQVPALEASDVYQ